VASNLQPPRHVCVLLATAAVSAFLAQAQSTRTIRLSPSTANIETLITSSPAGTTFIFEPGVYRHFSIAVRPGDTFLGMPGAILNGSEPLRFERQGELWAAQANPALAEVVSFAVPCDPALKNADGSKYTVGCTHSRSLYRGEEPLWRVETIGEVGPGKWFFDQRTKVAYISDDPKGDTVELGEMLDAFRGFGANVTIKGFTIEKYAGAQQHGAINCGSGNWLVEGNIIKLNHSRGISFGPCDGIRILGNTVSHNGNLGIGGSAAKNAIIQGNEIDANNYSRVSEGWEAGGGKWARTSNLVVSDNKVRDNRGGGLWSDLGAEGTVYSGNTVTNNAGAGISYEISRHGRIEKNTLSCNGSETAGKDPWLFAAQILISTSSDVVVKDNIVVVAEYGNGITIVDQKRGGDALGEFRSSNDQVTGNTITYKGDTGRSGGASDREKTFDRNNVFDGNIYHFLGAKGTKGHFYWAGGLDWDGFRAAGNEKNGQLAIGN